MKKVTAILSILLGIGAGTIIGSIIERKKIIELTEKKDDRNDKLIGYFDILNHWLALKESGKCLDSFLKKKGYHTIAIYGMGMMGNHLYEELKKSDVQIAYAIDKKAENTYSDLPMVSLEEELPKVDVIVVTATFAFNEIKEKLSLVVNCPILSLEDVVLECC